MGSLCSKPDTHSGGHQVLGSRDDYLSERPAPQTIGATPGSRIPVTSEKITAAPQPPRTTTAAAATTSSHQHQRSASAGSIPKSAIPVPTRTTSPPIVPRAPPPQVSKKDLPKKSRGKGAPTPSPEERRLAAAAAAEQRVKEQQARGIVTSNPNAGRLAAKLKDEKTAKPTIPSTRDEPELRWD
ncbi:hypothetical protein FRC04_010723 [Tulasnella sp. 424]|nr:hypothetical protein FRC04_010723 [Tulasnella sp. 424]KAG8962756.1 hypothetical protein FRC05_005122 [Tulasnella sp. 425]